MKSARNFYVPANNLHTNLAAREVEFFLRRAEKILRSSGILVAASLPKPSRLRAGDGEVICVNSHKLATYILRCESKNGVGLEDQQFLTNFSDRAIQSPRARTDNHPLVSPLQSPRSFASSSARSLRTGSMDNRPLIRFP